MAQDYVHVIVAVASGVAGTALFGPLAGIAVAAGNLIPDLDEYMNKDHGASWVTHSPAFASVLAFVYHVQPAILQFGNLVPALTFGVMTHVALDFISYEQRKATEKKPKSSLYGRMPDVMAVAVSFLPHIPFLFYGLV